MEESSSEGAGAGVLDEEESRPVLEAKYVYILMSKDHRISRNRRAEWFFSRFGSLVTLPKDAEITSVGESVDFHVVSAIPSKPPAEWSPKTRHSYRYRITTNTIVTYLSRRYRVVYCIDVSPSVASVDVQGGTVVFDRIFHALRSSLDGLMRPFYIPGSTTIFQPKIFITVITHSPFVASVDDEVILQGKLLGPSTYDNILHAVFQRLNFIENKMADMTSTLLQKLDGMYDNNVSLFDGDEDSPVPSKSSIAVSSDFSLVDLLKQALIALSLLPENSSSGLVILTDGVVSVPDGRYLDIILSQLRYNTVSCSFIQLSSPFHPHLCHGAVPYADLMRFIASATFGAFLTEAPEIVESTIAEMNVYHQAFLAWSFQSSDSSQADFAPPVSAAKPGEWSIRNKCFFTVRDMPIVKKQQYANPLAVDYMKVLSCRLREGFMIKEISLTPDEQYEIKLTLPWKFLIHLEYVLVTSKAPDSKVECILSLEGPYDFLHDVTCLAGRAFPSFYRQLMVNRFWATRKNLSESDRLLVHLNSFSSNSAYYNIPDSLRNGVPLFYFSPSSSVPILQSSDFPYPQFAQFWKPVCMLDTTVWQKWMHTHRIGIILEHDHPLPKHLHFPNSTGRFHVILCRQAVMALNTLLKNMSSFVLVENHSYVTLMYSENEKTPFSFYIIRVTSKPPYVVLRLAFLVGTPGNLRHQTVSVLREKITTLTFPQRLKEPPRWRFPTNLSTSTSEQSNKATWSDMPCCIIMQKPIEKILIRYDKIPENFCKVLMSQHPYESVMDQKSSLSKQSTFGFRPTHPNPLSTTTIMVPEVFNPVARYLHHRRWIWWFPKAALPHLSLKDCADILSTVTKMRLQEGFRFAYSSAGIVSMTMEVQMENKTCRPSYELSESMNQSTIEETYYTPLVLQFVVFPPATSLTGNFEGDFEAFEDAKDLFFITECWVEPQCGQINNCSFTSLNDLEFAEVPNKIFEINEECFLTLGTFEYLRGICEHGDEPDSKMMEQRKLAIQKKASTDQNTIRILPFEFELGRVLPKCQQTEILFSMFFQDLSLAFSVEKGDQFLPFHERANEILHNIWSSNLLYIHEKEIKVDSKQYAEILRMVLTREDDITAEDPETKQRTPETIPAWRCFVRAVDSSQLLVTLMPKTLRDTKLLFLSMEKSKCSQNGQHAELEPICPFPIPKHILADDDMSDKKQRCRKTSEPNCGVKPASASIATSLALELPFINGGRTRIRAFSGGESASMLKKAFRVHSAFNEILTHSFYDENSSKYIVPKDNKPIIVEDFEKTDDQCDKKCYPEVFSSFKTTTNDEQNESIPKVTVEGNQASMFGSLTMPLFVYDCSLTSLRDNVIFKGSSEIIDACLDFRIFKIDDETEKRFCTQNEMESPPRASDCVSHDSKTSIPETSEATRISVEEYCKELQLAYKTSYIRSVFQSLQLGYYISPEDLKAVISLCHKDALRIDITEFLKCVCMHLNSPKEESCRDIENIHQFIKRKFQDIISKDFNFVKLDSNLLYFKSNPRHRNHGKSFSKHSESSDTEYFDAHGNPRPAEYYRLSDAGQRRVSEDIERASAFPLFMYMRCTTATLDMNKSTMVTELPVCLDDLDASFVESILNSAENENNNWDIKLELMFLTAPKIPDATRWEARIENDESGTWPSLPQYQMEAVKNAVNEVQWLLDDEITSFRSKSNTLTAEILKDIASHVEKSVGKLGCFQQCIPLKFVNNARVEGHKSFIERFNNLSISGFSLKKMENWWYLMGENDSSKSENSSAQLEVSCNGISPLKQDTSFPSLSLPSNASLVSDAFPSSTSSSEVERRKTKEKEHALLPFWMIFRVEEDHVISYCHCRYNENDLGPLKRCTEMRELMLYTVMGLIRIVNQDLLLQSLHETRVCSPLLEPEGNRQSPEENRMLLVESSDGGMRTESDIEGQGGHNIPGMFSCQVVWETTFMLHPRLGSGPGKSAFSRGIQILRSTLIALEVTNRENMFVYRNSSGNVFYLRLYRVYETLEDVDHEMYENPSPRSSISSRSRLQEQADRQNREESMFGILKEPPAGPRDRVSDHVVLIKVHGVTEAGTEIKDRLIQALQNKLDDAVLDVLSVTLDRNPHCKLTPEDVHFIQRPNSSPDAVFKFTTGRFTKLLLPAFAFYLHQNLLQFLNIPKYTKQEAEYHFQDYFHPVEKTCLEEQNVYLYNQSPGGTGSRGVACVSVALIDTSESLIRSADWKRPSDFLFCLGMDELSSFIETEEITRDGQTSDVMVELCVWKQGRINLDILKNNFCLAIKHGGWDLAMEFQILTPSLSLELKEFGNEESVFTFGEKRGSIVSTTSSIEPLRSIRRRNSSVSPMDAKDTKANDQSRGRSWSFTGHRNPPAVLEKRNSELISSPVSPNPTHKRGSTISSETIRYLDLTSSKRSAVDDYERLHVNYATFLKRWCGLGIKMSMPSLRVLKICLKPRHYLDETVSELKKMISSIAPDNTTRQFWKLDKNLREFLAIGDNIYPEYKGVINQVRSEVSALKINERKLQSLERKDESEYPEELLSLFKTKEHFQPSSGNNFCIIIARNTTHWKTCVTNQKSLDPTFHIPEVMKSTYKFSPLMSESSGPSDDRSSFSLDKSRFSSRKGLLALLKEPCEDNHSMLIPRQRFLLATVSKTSIEFIFYNWSKESSDRLFDQTKLLAHWTQSRMQLLSSVLLQKSGLFYHQPFSRHSPGQDPNALPFGGADMKDVILSPSPIKTANAILYERSSGSKSGSYKAGTQLSDIYRNLHHLHLQNTSEDIFASPIKVHGCQMLSLLNSGKREIENALFRYWLSRGPSASNVIGMEAIEAFKQAARCMHLCMTPIMFLPRWRSAVALTRDSSVGLFKRARISDSEKLVQPKLENLRSRHASESSAKSFRSNTGKINKSQIWSVWRRTYCAGVQDEEVPSTFYLPKSSRKLEEAWHISLCSAFMQEYMQYLQTLGFIPTHSNSGVVKRKQPMLTSETWTASYVGRMERIRRMSDGSVLSATDSERSTTLSLPPPSSKTPVQRPKLESSERIFYLQKSLPGGIILLEVGLVEPFFYCKIHMLEAHRIQQTKSIRRNTQNALAFIDECDKMKVLMHLHSFAYDFHLRCIHSYVCGKQLIFKQGYHITKFLDDFISYYCKGPNFARNTVHIGLINMHNVSTPSHILFNYILSHDKTYQMKVMRMIPLNITKAQELLDPLQVNEYILVYNLSKKVVFKESEEESHYDEFDMSLLIAHDSPSARPYSTDPSVLRMKYYILLTSRRELYPKVVSDPHSGKVYPVTAPEPLSVSQLRPCEPSSSSFPAKRVDVAGPSLAEPQRIDSTNVNYDQNMAKEKENGQNGSRGDVGPDGIREEKVLYLGYFSSHEQMMQQLVKEQTKWAENFIHTVIGKAAIDCRRDLLWQRLLVGGRLQEKFKGKKPALTIRETIGILTYWEFSELLELVRIQPLPDIDSRLQILLQQPMSFFQSLIKLLTYGNQYQHRYFVSPDGSVHQLAIINLNINKSVVMVDMNLERQSCNLSVVFKEMKKSSGEELDPEILNLIETAVSACCYCNWINFL